MANYQVLLNPTTSKGITAASTSTPKKSLILETGRSKLRNTADLVDYSNTPDNQINGALSNTGRAKSYYDSKPHSFNPKPTISAFGPLTQQIKSVDQLSKDLMDEKQNYVDKYQEVENTLAEKNNIELGYLSITKRKSLQNYYNYIIKNCQE